MDEAARYTGLPVRRLQAFIRDGMLAANYVTPHTAFIARTELDRFMTEGKRKEKPKVASPAFVKPTIEEVAAFIKEKGYTVNATAFWNYYESNGWMIGKSKMKKWKAAVATWQTKEHGNRQRKDNQLGLFSASTESPTAQYKGDL